MDRRNRGNARWKPIQATKVTACLERILPHINDDLSVPLDDPLSLAAFPFGRVYADGAAPPIRLIFTLPDLILRLTLSERHVCDPRPILSDKDFRDHLTLNDIVRVEYLTSRHSRNQLWQEVATGKRDRISLREYRSMFPTTDEELACLRAAPIPFPVRTNDQGDDFLVSRDLVAWHEKIAALRRESEGPRRTNGHGPGNGYGGAR